MPDNKIVRKYDTSARILRLCFFPLGPQRWLYTSRDLLSSFKRGLYKSSAPVSRRVHQNVNLANSLKKGNGVMRCHLINLLKTFAEYNAEAFFFFFFFSKDNPLFSLLWWCCVKKKQGAACSYTPVHIYNTVLWHHSTLCQVRSTFHRAQRLG